MKRFILSVLMTALTVAAVTMSMMPSVKAQNETIVFSAQLLAANEVGSAVVPSELGASGQAIITMDVTRSGGVITAATSRFDVTLTGLASNSVVILSHIHMGASGVAGGVVLDSGLTPATSIPAAAGNVSYSRGSLVTSATLAQSIITNPAGFYFNVHTALSPVGVARGQLVRVQQTTGVAAPTLSEWGAILMTLLFLAVGTFFLVGRTRTAEAVAGVGTSVAFGASTQSIDWRLLARVALYVEVMVALALIALRPGLVNVMGALTAGLVTAFIIHLFVQSARQRKV